MPPITPQPSPVPLALAALENANAKEAGGEARATARSVGAQEASKPAKPAAPVGALGRRLSSFTVDWLRPSESYEGDLSTESEQVAPPRLNLLDFRINYDVCPAFVERNSYIPVIDLEPPSDSPQARGFKKLFHRELFRQFRRVLKKQWRSQYRNEPNMIYDSYESRLLLINRIGREADAFDQEGDDYFASQFREDTFKRGRDGEAELPVAQWGPFIILDSGALNLDLSRIRDLGSSGDLPEVIKVAPEPSLARKPLFAGKSYRVHTNLRIDVDPFRIMRTGEPASAMRSVGGTLQVVWLTDILRRTRFITECEAQYGSNNELVVFFNFVMRSR